MDSIIEGVPSEFNYFEPKAIQAAVANEFDQEIIPPSLMQNAPIEFEVALAGVQYMDLNNSKIEVNARIVQSNGTAVGAGKDVGPVNLTLHSMFQRVEVDLCDKTISLLSNLYPYRSLIESKLTYPKEVLQTRLTVEGWNPDTDEKFDDFKVGAGGANLGFKERATIWKESAVVTLIGRPHLDLFHQNLNIPPGCTLRLRFYPAPVDFFIKKPADNAETYKLEILKMRLWIHIKEVIPSFNVAHEKMLERMNYRLPFTRTELKTLTIPTGISSFTKENVYQGILPYRVILALISDKRFNGDATLNPFLFGHFDLSEIKLVVNGQSIPRVAYTPDFTKRNYKREYLGLLEGLGIDQGTQAINLEPKEWASNFPLFMFPISPVGLPSLPKSGTCKVEIRFSKQTTEGIILLLFSEQEAIIEIDKNRQLVLA